MENLPSVTIYTDGACEPNPGKGGWAAILIWKTKKGKGFDYKEVILTGHHPHTTNNRMELTAIIESLKSLDQPHQVEIYTDSMYCIYSLWWKRKQSSANMDLLLMLQDAKRPHQINAHRINGHAGNKWNERVDALSVAAIQR